MKKVILLLLGTVFIGCGGNGGDGNGLPSILAFDEVVEDWNLRIFEEFAPGEQVRYEVKIEEDNFPEENPTRIFKGTLNDNRTTTGFELDEVYFKFDTNVPFILTVSNVSPTPDSSGEPRFLIEIKNLTFVVLEDNATHLTGSLALAVGQFIKYRVTFMR